MAKEFSHKLPAKYSTYIKMYSKIFITHFLKLILIFGLAFFGTTAIIELSLTKTFNPENLLFYLQVFPIVIILLVIFEIGLSAFMSYRQAKKIGAKNVEFIINDKQITHKAGDLKIEYKKNLVTNLKVKDNYITYKIGGRKGVTQTGKAKEEMQKILKDIGYKL